MRTAIEGRVVGYDDEGKGTALVLLHAFPLNRRMWDPQLAELKAHARVVAPDARGFGESALGSTTYSLEDIASDVEALCTMLGIQSFVLGGLSMGGYTALAFARRFGWRLRGLILADTKAKADSPEARERRLDVARDVESSGMAKLAESMPPTLLSHRTLDAKGELVERVGGWIAQADAVAVAAAQRAMARRPDSTPELRHLRVPVLVLVGEEDALSPPSEAEAMAGAFGAATTIRIPGAGHLSNLENPAAFNRAVRDFLARL